MDEFEKLLAENRNAVERFVRFKISNYYDADDIIQDVCLTAFSKFDNLINKDSFKAWIISIAKNKCNDYYRKKAKSMDIPLDSLSERVLSVGRCGITVNNAVSETLELLGDKEKQILYLCYFKEMSQEEISHRLNIPLGTVKSRLHYAKQKFKEKYPYQPKPKGEINMKKLPEILPEYKIEKLTTEPFEVIHEELPGMFIIPRIGESITFGMYDFPMRKQSGEYKLSVMGGINLHGIDGVVISKEYRDSSVTEKSSVYAQLTNSHCRYLGGMTFDENGNQRIMTFLDSDFEDCFAIGENNCGFPVNRIPRGDIIQNADGLCFSSDNDISDIVGSYRITIGDKKYDTVRLIDFQNIEIGGMLCEYYLDKNGKTVLWRRFNKNDWAIDRYKKQWTEMLPENETLTVNGEIYVHWYDCITDYVI